MYSFWTKKAKWGRGTRVTQIPEFWENEELTTDSARIQQVEITMENNIFEINNGKLNSTIQNFLLDYRRSAINRNTRSNHRNYYLQRPVQNL